MYKKNGCQIFCNRLYGTVSGHVLGDFFFSFFATTDSKTIIVHVLSTTTIPALRPITGKQKLATYAELGSTPICQTYFGNKNNKLYFKAAKLIKNSAQKYNF